MKTPIRYSRAWFEGRGGYIPPPLLTPDARRQLIEQPITFRVLPKKIWAGVLITDHAPEEGRRFHVHTPDEQDNALSLDVLDALL